MPPAWFAWDETVVTRALASPTGLDQHDRDGVTALWLAVYFGRPVEVARLLAAGARLDAHDPARIDKSAGSNHLVSISTGRPGHEVDAPVGRSTLLHVASAKVGDRDVIEQLLAAGVPIDARDAYGCTALHIASFAGRKNAVELLLARGADPNVKCRSGRTALDHGWAHIPALEALLAGGADPTRTRPGEKSIIATAAYCGRDDAFRVLVAADPRVAQEPTALPIACKVGNTTMVRLLLAAGAPVTGTIEWRGARRGPLEAAAMYASLECAELVLSACRDALDSALVTAVAFADEDADGPPNDRAPRRRALVVWLLEQGAKPDPALPFAATAGDEGLAKILLERGARVDTVNADGELPLVLAARSGRHRVVRLLLAAGADAKSRAKDGALAYDVAAGAYRAGGNDDARVAMNVIAEAGGEPVATPDPSPEPIAPSGPVVGGRVGHAKFGGGTIQRIDGDKLVILFESGETRTLMSKFVTAG